MKKKSEWAINMKKNTDWLEEQYVKISAELKRSTKTVDEILDELGYSEEEKNKIRWVFI